MDVIYVYIPKWIPSKCKISWQTKLFKQQICHSYRLKWKDKKHTFQDCLLSSVSKLEWRIDTRTIDRADNIADMKVNNDTVVACFLFPEGTSQTILSSMALAVLPVDMKMQLLLLDFPSTLQRVNRQGWPNWILEYPWSPRGYKENELHDQFTKLFLGMELLANM